MLVGPHVPSEMESPEKRGEALSDALEPSGNVPDGAKALQRPTPPPICCRSKEPACTSPPVFTTCARTGLSTPCTVIIMQLPRFSCPESKLPTPKMTSGPPRALYAACWVSHREEPADQSMHAYEGPVVPVLPWNGDAGVPEAEPQGALPLHVYEPGTVGSVYRGRGEEGGVGGGVGSGGSEGGPGGGDGGGGASQRVIHEEQLL